ncbi:MAG: 2-C-methyl-D-erythritol 2,4-cyclodiphosphate synthase [Spirochaetota bacterium]
MRIGFGWDLHQLVEGRNLILGGIHIEAPFGESGHSDGDVLLHAVIDALLGAAALGDIGSHFPPSDPRWKDIASSTLLTQALELVHDAGFNLVNLDSTIVLQRPKLAEYIPAIQTSLAELLMTSRENISVKAKTKEHVDATGEGRAIEAYAAVLLENPDPSVWV